MGKVKYQFNPTSLEIEAVELGWKGRFRKILSYIITGGVFAVISVVVAFQIVDSPKEKALKREIEQYKLHTEMMHDQLDKINIVLTDLEQRDDNIYRVIFGAEPVPRDERYGGIGGADRYKHLEGFESSEQMVGLAKNIDELSNRLVVQSKSFDRVFEMAKKKEDMLAHIPGIVPIKDGAKHLVSGFGYRIHPIYRTRRMHTGVDIAVKRGTPIYAAGDGKVVKPKSGMSGYGITVMLDHGYGYQSLYAHMSKRVVKPGQKIKRGQLIGYVGSSGVSVGPHLHYEVIHNGNKVNPVHYFYSDLNPSEYQEVIEKASQDNQPLS